MPKIPALRIEQAPEASRPVLEEIQSNYGTLLNVFKTMAHSPAFLSGYIQFYQAMETNSLSPRERETVSLAVSQVNGCGYCMSVHTMMAAKGGMSPEAIRAARDGKLDAFAALAHQIALTRGQINDEDLATARAAGLTDSKIVEVIAEVALMTVTNLLNNVAGTTLELPPVDM
ncbi:peroxidase-related enzyme [Cupriavidus sp. BIC8F]|uniref:carboxymuconolactone decarboxylase family protein n=1 Tax=Cupriavidus sp. BIC8F TaxID=3079014 RepID=UPI002915DE0C|nr:peroxidase-related enzyme [Cupriavidus sp. BIC8F]